MLSGFKQFILRGNVVDMAVGAWLLGRHSPPWSEGAFLPKICSRH